jgi:hypothetical protein
VSIINRAGLQASFPCFREQAEATLFRRAVVAQAAYQAVEQHRGNEGGCVLQLEGEEGENFASLNQPSLANLIGSSFWEFFFLQGVYGSVGPEGK